MMKNNQFTRLSDVEKQTQPLPCEISPEKSYPILMHAMARLGAQYRLPELVHQATNHK